MDLLDVKQMQKLYNDDNENKIKTYKRWEGFLSLTSVGKHYKLTIEHALGAGPNWFSPFYQNCSEFRNPGAKTSNFLL